MAETAQAYAWVVATMQADTALLALAIGGIWQDNAPIGTLMPYAQVLEQASTDVLTVNKFRVFTNIILQIKAVGPSSLFDSALTPIANRIDALFKEQRNIALSPGGYMLSSYREQELSYGELSSGVQVSHLGGLYHIELQGA